MVRTSPFHGGNMGSSPVGITNTKSLLCGGFFVMRNIDWVATYKGNKIISRTGTGFQLSMKKEIKSCPDKSRLTKNEKQANLYGV